MVSNSPFANSPFARRLRLSRLHRHRADRFFIVPLDHSVTDGPITGGSRVDRLVATLAAALGIPIFEITADAGSLEQAFLRLTAADRRPG